MTLDRINLHTGGTEVDPEPEPGPCFYTTLPTLPFVMALQLFCQIEACIVVLKLDRDRNVAFSSSQEARRSAPEPPHGLKQKTIRLTVVSCRQRPSAPPPSLDPPQPRVAAALVPILINPDVDINKMKAGLDAKQSESWFQNDHAEVGHLGPPFDKGMNLVSILKNTLWPF